MTTKMTLLLVPFFSTALLMVGGCSQQPEDIIKDYFGVEKWEERLSMVLDPEIAKPLMESYYDDWSPTGETKIERITRIDGKGKVDIGEYIKLKVTRSGLNAFGNRISETTLYYVKRTPDGYKINWQASLGINEMSWNAYKAQRPTVPIEFRVQATLGNYYNYEFINAQHYWWSIDLENFLYRYVKKDSESGRRMYELLKDGEGHNLIVKIRFLPNGDPSGNVVLIEDLISDSWLKEN